LIYYLRKNPNEEKTNAKFYYKNIISALLRCLELVELKNEIEKIENGTAKKIKKNYTKTTFLNRLDKKKTKHKLLSKIAVWANEIHICKNEYNENVIEEIRNYLNKIFNKQLSKNGLKDFIEKPEIIAETKEEIKTLIYTYPKNTDIKIEIGTVHSDKGETHTATLYMETSYQGEYEMKRISDFLLNKKKNLGKLQDKIYHNHTLKMVHVGFSRPTHLLCFAVCKSRITEEDKKLLKEEWDINEI